jgi:SulP family sulfate permease
MQPSSLEVEPGLMIYRFSHSVYYANTDLLFGQVTALVTGAAPSLKWFCIDAAAVDDVDFTGAETLRSLHGILKDAGVKLIFAHVSAEVRTTLEKYAIAGLLEKDAFFDSLRTVLHAYERSGNGHGGKA